MIKTDFPVVTLGDLRLRRDGKPNLEDRLQGADDHLCVRRAEPDDGDRRPLTNKLQKLYKILLANGSRQITC